MAKDGDIIIELDPEIFVFKGDDYSAVAHLTTPAELLSERANSYADVLDRAYQPKIKAIVEGARVRLEKARTKGKRLAIIQQRDVEIEALLVQRDAEVNNHIWREMDKLVRRKGEQGRGRPAERGRFLTDLMREIRNLHEQGKKPTQERAAERLGCTERNIRERLDVYKVDWRTFVRQSLAYKPEGN